MRKGHDRRGEHSCEEKRTNDNRNFFSDVSSSSGRKPFSVVIKKLNVYFGHRFFFCVEKYEKARNTMK